MRILHHLQQWLTGRGLHVAVVDFVPERHSLRQGPIPCRGQHW